MPRPRAHSFTTSFALVLWPASAKTGLNPGLGSGGTRLRRPLQQARRHEVLRIGQRAKLAWVSWTLLAHDR
ncbi:hypothetical protein PsYK624_090820 [Phanerochaete sordida]|uniref:Secreted protein n=1 Tax=Phanerochaete sordida TaxID=48140 RepID=A0A9P3LFQ2_9APHY|nr:hypothetical protein PsYK624_090820 [Phanerochaete sordida]